MRGTVLKLIEDLAARVEFPEPVYEFGARRVDGQEHLPAISSLFPRAHFVGCDIESGIGVDEIEDVHRLSLPDESIGSVLLLDTIEHVREPWRAMAELRRCLRPGGLLVMTSVMFFPVHAYPDDYWRFTASGFGVLLDGLEAVVVEAVGHPDLPHTVVAVASKNPVSPELREEIIACVNRWKRHGASSWKERALMLVPPGIVAPGYRAFHAMQARRNRARLR
jgi:SAM-dependent methyltransferase